MEVRKGEAGMRAWQAKPGELYHQTSAERGGLWRLRGRPPQKLTGVGFTTEGFDFCRPLPAHARLVPQAAAWIFEGIGDDEVIGDFGLALGGAAGLEIERYDLDLGTPPHALLLATADGFSDNYPGVHEDILFNYNGLMGTQNPLVRADMVYFTTRNDGAVLSTGSIAWASSLPSKRLGQQRLADHAERARRVRPRGLAAGLRVRRGGEVVAVDRATFDHIGIVTEERHDGEVWVEPTRVWVTNPRAVVAQRRVPALRARHAGHRPAPDRAARRLPRRGRRAGDRGPRGAARSVRGRRRLLPRRVRPRRRRHRGVHAVRESRRGGMVLMRVGGHSNTYHTRSRRGGLGRHRRGGLQDGRAELRRRLDRARRPRRRPRGAVRPPRALRPRPDRAVGALRPDHRRGRRVRA